MTLEEVTRLDLLKFSAYLREEKGQGARSTYNKFQIVISFLKAQGVTGLATRYDWPRYTEKEPVVYEQAELDSLFAACNPQEKLWFEFFLMTGEREQEVVYSYWSDVNFAAGTVRVTAKPDEDWSPKKYEEREIPVPARLIESLRVWREKSKPGRCPFLFPTTGCRPKHDFLDCLKAIAMRAGLDDDNYWLHKFRSTFATRSLSEVDVRTVQLWMGHSDIESTMRYLAPSRSQKTQDKVNTIWG
jgi:integrase